MVLLVAKVWWCCCGVLCCLGGWWGPLVDVDVTPGDFDAVGAMACGVVVSTLGWGPWMMLFFDSSRAHFGSPWGWTTWILRSWSSWQGCSLGSVGRRTRVSVGP